MFNLIKSTSFISMFLFTFILVLVSCEKVIEVDLNSTNAQIVIEGNITDGAGPHFVKVSKTSDFGDVTSFNGLAGAKVIITDNTGTNDTLTETSTGIFSTSKIIGKPGQTYFLSVEVEGKKFNAISRMPALVRFDSIRFSPLSTPGDQAYSAIPVFSDRIEKGDNYRFIVSVNGKTSETYIVFNDNVSNGTINQRPILLRDPTIKQNDTVKIEMRTIEASAYEYFYTLSQIVGGGPFGGGTTPSNPPNNITGDVALGLFSAHTSQVKIAIVF